MIVVTGASGFIGSHLCAALARKRMAHRPVARRPVAGGTVIGPIDGSTDWTEALSGASAVVHLAAHVHTRGRTTIEEFRRVNVDATLKLTRQAHETGLRCFVFVSSIAVNGNHTQPGRPFGEESPPALHDNYGRSKYEAEIGLREFARASGLDVTIIRPPLVYGPGVFVNFSMLMRTVASGVPLPFASVSNLLSLVSVENLVDFITLALDHPMAAGATFLVADGQDLSTPELLRRVGGAVGRPTTLFAFPPGLLAAAARLAGKARYPTACCHPCRSIAPRLPGILVGWPRNPSIEPWRKPRRAFDLT